MTFEAIILSTQSKLPLTADVCLTCALAAWENI